MSVSLAKSEVVRSAALAGVSDFTLVRMLATLETEVSAVATAREHIGEHYGRHCSVYVAAGERLEAIGYVLAGVHRERVARMIPLPLFA